MVLAVHLAMVAGLAISAGWADPAHAQQAETAAGGQAGSTSGQRDYDIPAGPLNAVLVRFLAESGVLLSGSTDLAQGKRSPGVKGSHTGGAALAGLLAGTGLEAVADAQGRYALRITPGGSAPQPMVARSEGLRDLAEVRVTAKAVRPGDLPDPYAGGQVARGGRVGLLGNKEFMETPYSTISYTAEQVQNTQATNIAQVIAATDAGVEAKQNSASYYETFQIRGFAIGSYDMMFNGVSGMAPYYRPSPEIAERVEVLKGPSAMLNGMPLTGGVGGSINIVPKRAGNDPLSRLTGIYMSDSRIGLHADVGRRFGENKEWGIRFNGSYRDGDTARDDQKHQNDLASLALDYRGQRVRASLDVYRQDDRVQGAPYRIVSLQSGQSVPRPVNPRGRLGQPWGFSRGSDEAVLFKGELDLGQSWTAFAAIGRQEFEWDGLYDAYRLLNSNGDADAGAWRQRISQRRTTGELGLRGTVQAGSVRHEVAVQMTSSRQDGRNKSSSRLMVGTDNIYDSVGLPRPDLSSFDARQLSSNEVNTRGVGFSDTLAWWNGDAQLVLGVRRQNVRRGEYAASAWTPTVALLLRATSELSVYGNYIEGLEEGSIAPTTAANAGEVFPPYKTKQVESGFKYDAGRFAVTAGIFQIQQASAYTDPTTNVYSVKGEQRNLGLEINTFGEPLKGVRVMGGVALIRAKLNKTEGGANEGNVAPNTPARIAKLGLEHDVGAFPGFTLTGNMTYTGSLYIDATNNQSIPGWMRYDLGVRYATRLAGRPVTLRASVLNATNKAYWLKPPP